ncbi:MAG: N-acetyl-alpha-D-glucosaminyl L-malate synthase BshA [Bacteroidota bacterium]
MKIGIVCYPTYGGSGVVATELGKALADKGHFVHFISYKQPARLESFHERIFYHEVSVNNYPLFDYPPYESALAGKLVDVIEHEKLDILHVHYAIPHAAAAYMAQRILASKNKCIPYITTLHGTDITLVGKDETFGPLVAFSINESNGITAVSEDLKNETFENFEINKEIKVIPNFIDLKRFKTSNKEHFRKAIAPNDEKILIHTSNFRKVKRVEDVVYMFENVVEKIPAKLLLVGDGPERHHIEQLCRSLDLCEHIRFLGKQDALEELLALADLFILPSEYESFGLVALEAMACKVPVISSNAGGLPEVNIHGKTGFTANVGDIDAMSEYALKLLTDKNLLTEFKENALQQAKNFELSKILPLYEKYYEEVLKNFKADCK